ncbi:MAG: DUF4982 domain-containing protein [Mariniphaga sp.]|nr:DUF4982 domain-containing protein [Mariniphaga sp.]
MKTKNSTFTVFLFLVVIFLAACTPKFNDLNREVNFNSGWKFIKADIANAHEISFDETGWRDIVLPHDWSIEDLASKEGVKTIGPFSEESVGAGSTGHVVGGTAWYRKYFVLDKADEGKIISILFDGVYMDADVWINEHHLGNHPYGCTAFSYDLTSYLNPVGENNVIAVQVKNEGKNSRWYSGSGIYRNVSLIKTNPVHIELWGNFITTPDVSNDKATVAIETKMANASEQDVEVEISVTILDPQGSIVGESEKDLAIVSGSTGIVAQQISVDVPNLWSLGSPTLYTAVIEVEEGEKLIDQEKIKFGIRSTEFSPEKGFLLNGESVLLKGACLHHDNGPLGSATFRTAEYRRVRTMKENGFNAIRVSHNPPSKVFLDACDEIGMLVMDESFDQWQRPKNPKDYNRFFDEWWERDMESMLLRDRNHPSIIIWSIGNEIGERADSSGLEIAKLLKGKILELDKTRPVTQAICHFWDQPGREWDDTAPAFAQMDVHGYNYRYDEYEPDHEKYPERIIIGTESFPKEAFENWQMVEKYPYVIGDFVWTGMDYLGESGIGNSRPDNIEWGFLPPWPWYNAYCGDISILGYKKPQMFYRDVVWRNSKLEMLVHAPIPEGRKEIVSMWGWPEEWKSWNWEGNEGKPLQVSVYSRCNEVRLELNGKVIGSKVISEETPSVTQMQNPMQSREIAALTAKFEVPYSPGELVAIGINDGKEIVRQSLKTTGKPVALKIIAEQDQVKASSDCLAYFNIEVVDENGLLVPNAEIPVDFNIKGNCKLQAVANGNPADMKSFQWPAVKTFRGRCQIIIRSNEKGGEIEVSAKSEGLKTGVSIVKVI